MQALLRKSYIGLVAMLWMAAPALADWLQVSRTVPQWLTAGNAGTVYAADTASVYVSLDAGNNWKTAANPQIGSLSALNFNAGQLLVGSTANGAAFSGNDGGSWTVSNNGLILPLVNKASTINAIVAQAAGKVLAATENGVYISADGGVSWNASSTGLPVGGSPPFVVTLAVKAAVVSPDNKLLVVGGSSGLYSSADGGNWSAAGLAGKSVTALYSNGQTLYALVSGDGMYQSTDAANWKRISALSFVPSAFAASAASRQQLFAGNASGEVWGSSDGGASWTQLPGSLPTSPISTMAVAGNSGATLLVANGSGVYQYQAPAISIPAIKDVPLSTVILSDEITITGLLAPTAVSISGGEYQINGGAFTNSAGTVVNGSRLRLRLTSSSSFSTATTANLTVGGKNYAFTVTTIKQTVLTSVTQVLQTGDPNVQVDNSGRLLITASPTQPLQLRSDAPPNALVVMPKNTQATIQSGTQVLTYVDVQGNSLLQTQTVGGQPALQVASGRFQIDSNSSGNNLPVGGTASNPALLQTQSGQTTLVVGRSGSQTDSFVQTGKVNYSNGGSPVPVFGGETLKVNESGALQSIVIGSIDGDRNLPGDPLKLNNLDSGTRIPLLNGGLPRLAGGTLLDVLQSALNTLYGVTTSQISYDATTGVITYIAKGISYHFTPIGQPFVTGAGSVSGKARDTTVPPVTKPSGTFTVASQGISITVSTSLAYLGDLDKALKSLDPAARLSMRSNGSLKISFLGSSYLTIPGGIYTGGDGVATPSFTTDLSGYLAFVDSSKATQVLYPVFSDIAVGDQTIKTFDPAGGASENGDGTASVVLLGGKYSSRPDYSLIPVPAAHASELFWSEGGKFFLRYPDGTAQGFSFF
ncbi:WD40/YVTN/BNR-like repeat-containing protein [Chitinimonas sp.]|uniref:WD40/YVTN/BNR-like repeat-containing protein n=1 Tax=Chitinimonas sp. TaxID=1934313 RepID=UPI0035B0C45B